MRTLFAGVLAACLAAPAAAQEWLGANVSSYTGMHAAFANPAMLGIMRNQLQVGIVSTNAQISTNMLSYSGPRGLGLFFKGYSLAGNAFDEIKGSNFSNGLNALFSPNSWTRLRTGEHKDFSATAEVRGPFVAGTLGSLGFALGYRLRGGIQIRNVSPAIADLFFSGLKTANPLLIGTQLRDATFSASANAYHEIYGSLAFPMLEIGPHYLGGGVTLKYLAGMYSAALTNRGLSYTLDSANAITTTQADLSFQYVDNPVFASDPFGGRGFGAGVDLGLVYEMRGLDAADNPYKTGKGYHRIRAGLSAVDAGFIEYGGQGIRRFDFNATNRTVHWNQIDTLKVKGAAGLDSLFRNVFGARNATGSFSTGLPAVINAFVDVRVWKGVYVAGSATQSLTAVAKGGLRAFSGFTLIPRYESRIVEVALPMGIGMNYNYFQPGFYARVSGFFFGSDNLSTFFGASNRTGISFYMGGFVPFRK